MKKLICLILALVIIISVPVSVTAATSSLPSTADYGLNFRLYLTEAQDFTLLAEALSYLGLFKGTELGFELERAPNRLEALVTVIRLMGDEQAALSSNLTSTFSDVPQWAQPYAGYAEKNKIVGGMGDGSFGSTQLVTAQQYATMLLRVLKYSDNVDFTYDKSVSFCAQIGLLGLHDYYYYVNSTNAFTRNNVAHLMFLAQKTEQKGSSEPLSLALVQKGAITKDTLCGELTKKGESDKEITRALKNGYCNYFVVTVLNNIDTNINIPKDYADIFRESAYEHVKEGGTLNTIKRTLYCYKNIVVNVVHSSDIFDASLNTVAYFMYPNKIFLRDNTSRGYVKSALKHEIRHSVTVSIGSVALEEGLTEVYNHDVGTGLEGYGHNIVNNARVLAFLAGSDNANEAALNGYSSLLFYGAEANSGVTLDKTAITEGLAVLDKDYENHQAKMKINNALIPAVIGYFNQNPDASYQKHIDRLIAIGQVMYYPSLVANFVDLNNLSDAPSSYYTQNFTSAVDSILKKYSEKSGVSYQTLKDYYEANKDTRYFVRVFGKNSGKVYVKNATAYRVEYTEYFGKAALHFPNEAEAKAFMATSGGTIIPLEGKAFTEKSY